MKLAQREEIKEQQRLRKAGIDIDREQSEPNEDGDLSDGIEAVPMDTS